MTRLIEQMQAGLRNNALNSNATNAKLASGMNTVTKRAIDYITNPNLLGHRHAAGAGEPNDVLTVTFTGAVQPRRRRHQHRGHNGRGPRRREHGAGHRQRDQQRGREQHVNDPASAM